METMIQGFNISEIVHVEYTAKFDRKDSCRGQPAWRRANEISIDGRGLGGGALGQCNRRGGANALDGEAGRRQSVGDATDAVG
jgi:glutamate synthase domain-containing protein 3